MIEKTLFSTKFWLFDLSENNDVMTNLLVKDISRYNRSSDKQFNTNFLDFSGYGIKLLRDNIISAANNVLSSINNNGELEILSSRQHIIKYGECDSPHDHPDCDMTAIYYFKCPAVCGDLLLQDTRAGLRSIWRDQQIPYDKNGASARVSYRHVPVEGTLVIIPNYLVHSVEANLNTTEPRISIVSNLIVNKKTV